MAWLKKILQDIIDQINDEQFEPLEIEELEEISALIHRPESVGREYAARFLGISLSRFHELRDLGEIPEPKKRKGFKEKEYYMTDLKLCKQRLKNPK